MRLVDLREVSEADTLSRAWPAVASDIERIQARLHPTPEIDVAWRKPSPRPENVATRIASLKVGEHVFVTQAVYPTSLITAAGRYARGARFGAKRVDTNTWRVERWG